MLVFTNILFTWLLIKQLAGQNVESKIVTIGLIITLIVNQLNPILIDNCQYRKPAPQA